MTARTGIKFATAAAPRTAAGAGRRWWVALGLLLIACLSLRLWHPGALPPFDDESDYAWDALLIGAAVRLHAWSWLFVSLHDGVPPLFPWLAALLHGALSVVRRGAPVDPIETGRSLSTLAGLATVAALALAGRAWGAARGGLLAGGLYVISPWGLMTDRLGLLDGLLALWITLAAAATWRAAGERASPWWAVAAGLGLGLAVLTKSLGVLGWALPVVALACRRVPAGALRARRLRLELIYAIAAALFMPILLSGRVADLLYPFHLQTGVAQGTFLGRVPQALRDAGAYAWTYLTPPLALALAAAWAWALTRGAGPARYLAWWIALAGALLVAGAGSFFPPRYLAQLAPPLLLCGALMGETLVCRKRWGGAAIAALVAASLVWSVPFAAALLDDPARAPLPAIDRFQYIWGWPAGYGLPEALALARERGGEAFTLDVLAATNPPFDQAAIAFAGIPGARVAGVSLTRPLACAGGAGGPTFALLDTPRDDEARFRRANPRWRLLARFARPAAPDGGAYVLYDCAGPAAAP